MHDTHLSGRTDRPPNGQPNRRATDTSWAAALFARAQETQESKDIVADSLRAQGGATKLTTGFRVAIIASVLAACSPTGDFGRPQLDLAPLGATISADSEPRAWWYTDSRPNLTEQERDLRNRSWHFLDRRRPTWQESEPRFEVSAYYLRLVDRRPPDASWNRLNDDIRTDIRLGNAFFAVAARVQRTDRLRAGALARPTLAALDASEDLVARMAENAGIVGAVERSLVNRIASYEYAADRLASEAPSADERTARAVIRQLSRTLARTPAPRAADPLVIRAD
jgi:hypothetical protein